MTTDELRGYSVGSGFEPQAAHFPQVRAVHFGQARPPGTIYGHDSHRRGLQRGADLIQRALDVVAVLAVYAAGLVGLTVAELRARAQHRPGPLSVPATSTARERVAS